MVETEYDPVADCDAAWHEGLKCFVHSIEYIPGGRIGLVIMLTGNCVSMDGAIDLFMAIDPEVQTIITGYPAQDGSIRPGRLDTRYRKLEGKWHAFKGPLRPVRKLVTRHLNG